jgi:hypothetical protein
VVKGGWSGVGAVAGESYQVNVCDNDARESPSVGDHCQ